MIGHHFGDRHVSQDVKHEHGHEDGELVSRPQDIVQNSETGSNNQREK